MASALKGGVKEDINQLAGKTPAYNACAEAENVGIVVQSCVAGGEMLRADGRTDALVFIRGDGHSDSRSANQYSLFGFPLANGGTNLFGNIGIINGTSVI